MVSMYLLDTNIIIGLLNNDFKIIGRIREENKIYISVITVGEMLYGANNSINKEKNTKLYKDFFETCNIVTITDKTAEGYANIRYELKKMGKPIPENDIWIAAVAREKNMTIVTRDKHLLYVDCIKTEEW
ncbi:MAG TPA: VapC toxin family PIN domain ribonuclease [Clostridiales bacterium]|nr:MAG: hypothetical protein A2Y22_07665 [Clostridiales bacterium GWD2_32_59]HAN09190.1 VapC toxin family PIN domain ribonuclease [Clostridiales bacterium]